MMSNLDTVTVLGPRRVQNISFSTECNDVGFGRNGKFALRLQVLRIVSYFEKGKINGIFARGKTDWFKRTLSILMIPYMRRSSTG